jgi:nucleoside-diphosphate-sugar epimerase
VCVPQCDSSLVPVLVHLADPFPHSALQAVPREKDVPKAGMIEALLEQMLKIKIERGHVPHFSYASSYEVYPYASNATMNPLTESQPITTPSSLRGASKLIDEVLAKLYFDEHGLYSVGLRFFSVYGPWSVPGSPLFEMGERAVGGQLPNWNSHWKTVQDFVYIDDAIDAVMAAMQFRPPGEEKPHPLVINVASGQGTSLQDVATMMTELLPPTEERHDVNDHDTSDTNTKLRTVAFGSTKRAEEILGYRPRVSLKEGIIKLLAWHFDRAFPYGNSQMQEGSKSNYIASQGIVSCLPTDDECLKATPVFPCSSECSHEGQCTKSFYDEIVGWTQALTAQCTTVLYTVSLDDSLNAIPSAHVKVQTTSQSFFDGTCNIAFVSEASPLVQSLRGSNPISAFIGSDRSKLLTTGKWILVPVLLPSFSTGNEHILSLLPKLSPGLFFGPNTKRAIYVDPDILLDSIPKLLREASMQPRNADMEGATAMLIGKGKPNDFFAQGDEDDFVPRKQVFESTNSIVQNSAYRMVRIAVSDKLFGDGFAALLDSRWMVHTLQSDDSRLFRCDVFGEVVQWDVETDRSALEFVLGLHDMWSRVIAVKPWWMGENVVTVPEGPGVIRRRLLEEDDEEEEASGDDDETEEEEEEEEIEDEDDEVQTVTDADSTDIDEENVRAGFGMKGEDVEEVAAGDKKRGDSSEQDDDQVQQLDDVGVTEDMTTEERDFSAYDTWMGVLSATSIKYFVRIVPSSEVGVVSLNDYEKSKLER